MMVISKLKDIVNDELSVDIDSPTRQRNHVEARGLYFTILKNNTKLTLSDIGATVNKDHATVLYSLNQFDNWLKQNYLLSEAYDKILQKVDKSYTRLKPKDLKRENAELKYQLHQYKLQVKRLQKELSV